MNAIHTSMLLLSMRAFSSATYSKELMSLSDLQVNRKCFRSSTPLLHILQIPSLLEDHVNKDWLHNHQVRGTMGLVIVT